MTAARVIPAEEWDAMVAALIDFAGLGPRQHYECEDGWYSCPMHPEYFGPDAEVCSCGAADWNVMLIRHTTAIALARAQGLTKGGLK